MAYRKCKRRKATACVELALLLPFLCFIFVAAVDFARIFYFSLTLANCALNGAYYAAAVDNYPGWEGSGSVITSIQQAALADAATLTPALTTSDVTVTSGSDSDGSSIVTVTVTYQFTTITNFPGITSVFNLARGAQVRLAPTAPK